MIRHILNIALPLIYGSSLTLLWTADTHHDIVGALIMNVLGCLGWVGIYVWDAA